MNTTKKIAVALAVMMVAAAMAAPAAMGVDYSATVSSGQSTVVTLLNGTFGSAYAGDTIGINNSLNLTNEGNADCNVSAAFTTNESTTYGLTNSTQSKVIPGTSFSLGTTGNLTALGATNASVWLTADNQVGAASGGNPTNVTYDAQLDIPAGQVACEYTGTVELSLSDV